MGSPLALYFNAGMFVFEPSLATYESLLDTLKITPPTPFAEQDFLNVYFRDVYKPIPNVYNLVLAMLWIGATRKIWSSAKSKSFTTALRDRSHGGTRGKKRTCKEKTSKCLLRNGGTGQALQPLIAAVMNEGTAHGAKLVAAPSAA